jgi:hypothetical protein
LIGVHSRIEVSDITSGPRPTDCKTSPSSGERQKRADQLFESSRAHTHVPGMTTSGTGPRPTRCSVQSSDSDWRHSDSIPASGEAGVWEINTIDEKGAAAAAGTISVARIGIARYEELYCFDLGLVLFYFNIPLRWRAWMKRWL